MAKKVARSAIHAHPQNTFSPQQANENTRDKWDRSRYEKKNEDTSHHYDITRKKLNFVVTADGIKPLDTTNTEKLYGRYLDRLAELNFKAYDPMAANQPNSYIDWVFSGDHDAMAKLAFGDQEVDFSLKTSNAHIRRMPDFEQYARDVYDFACQKFGKENVLGVEAHLDETTPHVHVNVIPVAMRQQKGRASYLYVNRNDPSKTITSKQYKALNSQARKEWERSTQLERKEILAVSYSGLIGETRAERGKYLKQFHTDFFEQVGKKYGLERGRPRETLSEEELKEVYHKTSDQLERERLENVERERIENEMKELQKLLDERKETLKQQDDKIKENNTTIQQQNKNIEEGKKEFDDVNSWFYRKGLKPKKDYEKENQRLSEEMKLLKQNHDKDMEDARKVGKADGMKETIEKIFKAADMKADDKELLDNMTPEQFGEAIKQIYDETKTSSQKETIKTILTTAKVSFGKDDKGNPFIPTPEQLGKDYGTRFNMAKELDSVKKDGKINSWLVRNLLHAPDRQLWNDMEFGQGQLNYRVIGSYAGIKFNCGFRDLDEATLPKILTNIQALPYDMATAADEGLRETVATVFMSYVSSQAPSGGGGGGSDDNWWKRKDEDWFKGAFNSVFRSVLPQVQGRKRK